MNIFITGGTSGMGAELAKLYLTEGHRVGVCGRDPQKFEVALREIFHSLTPLERSNLSFYPADVTQLFELESSLAQFLKGDKLDLFVANAGVPTGAKSRIPDFKKARKMIEINVLGVLNSLELAFNLMHKTGGQIAVVASVAGMNGLPGVGPYSGGKAAVIKMCESYGLDWKSFGITVTCLCPGFVDTPFTKINNHSMPFLMSAPRAASLMKGAIKKKKKILCFPFANVFSLLYIISYTALLLQMDNVFKDIQL